MFGEYAPIDGPPRLSGSTSRDVRAIPDRAVEGCGRTNLLAMHFFRIRLAS